MATKDKEEKEKGRDAAILRRMNKGKKKNLNLKDIFKK